MATTGKRYRLLFYRDRMSRTWKAMVSLAIMLAAAWYFGPRFGLFLVGSRTDVLLLTGVVIAGWLGVWAFVTRNMASVRVLDDHVRLVMPPMRVQISFRRMRSVKPTDVRLVYQGRKMSGRVKDFLRPYFGETAIALAVRSYPLPVWVLQLFFGRYYFLQKEPGFLLMIEDWMGFSTEFDTTLTAYREQHKTEKRRESMRGLF